MSTPLELMRRASPGAFREMIADVKRRAAAAGDDEIAGFLALWHERHHPLVRSVFRVGRSRRLAMTALLAAVPLISFAVALPMSFSDATAEAARWTAMIFLILWPTLLFIGAGLAAGSATASERERDTALQLVLTPLGKRPIAASKVLPVLATFLPAAAAALPMYLLAGCGVPPAFALLCWPLRLVLPALWSEPIRLGWWGALNGAGMWLSDLTLVWAAAHWGAAYGVRLGSTARVAAALLYRLVVAALSLGLVWAGTGVGAAAVMLLFSIAMEATRLDGTAAKIAGAVFLVTGVPAILWIFLRLWQWVFVIRPVRVVLIEFTHFSELAYDEFEPFMPLGWEIQTEYGDRT